MSLPALFLARALRLWVAARLFAMAAAALVAAVTGDGSLALAPPAALLMIALCVALGLLDVARRGERALLGNFGVSRARLAAWFALPAALGEAAVAALQRALA